MASGKHGHTIRPARTTTGSAALDAGPGELGTAIVHRACVDYLMVLRGRTKHGHVHLASREELEKFFHSAWFSMLCGADGDAILAELQRINRAGKKTIYYTYEREEQ